MASFTTLTSPATPTITSPTSGETNVSRNPTITSSTFSSSESFTHTSSTWQIATDSGFSSVVWSKSADTSNKTSIVVNATNGTFAGALAGLTKLALSTSYYVRVLYVDSDGGSTAYSTGVSFTVRAASFNRNAVDVQSPWTIDGASSEMLPDSAGKPSMIGVVEEEPTFSANDGMIVINANNNDIYFRSNGTWIQIQNPNTVVSVALDDYIVQSIDAVVICNKASSMTVTLPSATGSSRIITIKNINSGVVTIDGNDSETIDDEITQSLHQWESVDIIDGSSGSWSVI